MDWKEIERVNQEIKTVDLKGKQYAEVKERVIAYRKLYPEGVINTEPTFTDNYVMFKATATDQNGKVLANGYAREMLNKSFAIENAETSAIGRCLGFLGLGISTSIATKEDMEQIDSPSGIFDTPTPADIKALADEFKKLFTKEEQVRILNGLKITEVEQIGYTDLQKYIAFKKNEIKTNKGEGNKPGN